jgi:acyl-CoA dehydrogenase
VQGLGAGVSESKQESKEKKRGSAMVSTVVAAEELAWGDPAMLLCLPGPGLGGPPVRGSGTPEQKERFFSVFKDMSDGLKWGAYALTEPGAGSDVAGIRTSCRKDGDSWVLNGRKCYITNGARASWNVVFATIDPTLGRAGHRAFVVEKGTPGFGRQDRRRWACEPARRPSSCSTTAACPRPTCSAAKRSTKRKKASSPR